MSISTEISRISDNVSSALSAIADKGVTVPADSNSDSLATLIAQVETGVDTSDADADEGDIASGKTAYVNGKKLTGKLETTRIGVSNEPDAIKPQTYIRAVKCFTAASGTYRLDIQGYDLGDAGAGDVRSGKTFTAKSGVKLTGTLTDIDTSRLSVDLNGDPSEGVFDVPIDTVTPMGVLRTNTNYFGDATAADVATGKTFTSEKGLKITGTLVPVDVSGVTAEAKYLAQGYSFVNSDGTSVAGKLKPNTVRFEAVDGNVDVDGFEIHDMGQGYSIMIGYSILGNAETGDVLSGKTFSSDTDGRPGVKLTGTMPNNGAVEKTIDPLNMTGVREDVAIAKGYHDGSGMVRIDNSSLIGDMAMLDGRTSEVYTSLSGQYGSLKTAINTTQAELISQIVSALEAKGYTV